MYFIIKVIVTSIIIVGISELSKRSTFAGSVLASLPLTSLLAFFWLYSDSHDTEKISDLSISIFWLVIPSLLFFIMFPYLLRKNINFYWAMILSSIAMVIAYFSMIWILKKFGIKF